MLDKEADRTFGAFSIQAFICSASCKQCFMILRSLEVKNHKMLPAGI